MSNSKIYFNFGAMNSGKSLELIKVAYNFHEHGYKTLILKPSIDTRMPGFVYSRTGLKLEAFDIDCEYNDKLNQILNSNKNDIHSLLIEEANFLSKEVVDFIIDFAYDNSIPSVMFFGLKVDFRGDMFEGTKRIMERADTIMESTSVCWCGKKARNNARIVNGEIQKDGPQILIEDDKTDVNYITLCNYHYYTGDVSKK